MPKEGKQMPIAPYFQRLGGGLHQSQQPAKRRRGPEPEELGPRAVKPKVAESKWSPDPLTFQAPPPPKKKPVDPRPLDPPPRTSTPPSTRKPTASVSFNVPPHPRHHPGHREEEDDDDADPLAFDSPPDKEEDPPSQVQYITPPPPPSPPPKKAAPVVMKRGFGPVAAPPSRAALRAAAKETIKICTGLKAKLPTLRLDRSTRYTFDNPQRLNPNDCPAFARPASIRVVNEDTVNAAVTMAYSSAANDALLRNTRPALVNFANHKVPGGGWINGATAQEEAICYRTSLGLALHKKDYPLGMADALYTPDVVVVRTDMESGHKLITPTVAPDDLPVVSSLNVAALYQPKLRTFHIPKLGGGSGKRDKVVFASDMERITTKSKMRGCLRMAALQGHGLLVLGALGCGVFANPPEDVAHCWLEVLREDEFSGNWWRDVCFAVFEPRGGGNFEIFKQVLEGQNV